MPVRAKAKPKPGSKAKQAKQESNGKNTFESRIVEKGIEIALSYTDDPAQSGKRILIAGKSKSGRTTFALTYPNPVVFNFDKGLSAYQDKHIPVVDFKLGEKTYTKVLKTLWKLRDNEAPFKSLSPKPKTIILDDISACSEMLERDVIEHEPEGKGPRPGNDSGLYLSDYNVIQNRWVTILDVLKSMPFYVVAVTSVMMERDPDFDGKFEMPHVTGSKFPPRVPSFFDEVYYCSFDTSKDQYLIRIKPTKTFPYAGTKSGIKEETITDPSFSKLKKYYEPKKK